MIIPRFEISQNESHVQIDIKVPHVRVSSDSVQVVLTDDNKCLHFASPPYLLVLTFQNSFQENAEDSCAQYDPSKEHGIIVLKLAKREEGVHWEDLDLMGSLMQPRTNLKHFVGDSSNPQKSKWIQEVLSEETLSDEAPQEQVIQGNNNTSETSTAGVVDPSANLAGYGFHSTFRGIFSDLARDGLAREMLEAPLDKDSEILRIDRNPLSILSVNNDNSGPTNKSNQKRKRRALEASKFSSERYLQDMDVQDDYLYQNAMAMQPHWRQEQIQNSADAQVDFFTAEESAQLASIPYPLLPPSCHRDDHQTSLWLGLLDILFGYVYDHLLTDGDPTVESPWTISILSCSLSWLESFDDDSDDSVEDVVGQSIRRALVYPYLRNFDFAVFLWKHVSDIVASGRRCVIRCLLQIRTILDQSELYYLGNKLYIDPYLAWLQQQQRSEETPAINIMDERLKSLSREINNALVDGEALKSTIGLNLTNIEKELLQDFDPEDDASSSESSDEDSNDDDSSKSSIDSESTDDSIGIHEKQSEPKAVPSYPAIQNGQDRKGSVELLDVGGEKGASSSLLLEMASLSLNQESSEEVTATTKDRSHKSSQPLIEEIE